MAQEYELVKGFETENGTGLYDYEALANKPGVVSTGAPGFAPQLDGKTSSFLRGDGTWATPPNTTYNEATQSAAGLMSAADKKKVDGMGTTISNAIDAIDFPVDSVNGKTGDVVLDHDDVGAVSWDEYAQAIVQKANVVKEAKGEVITVSDSAEAPLQGLKVFGKTTQNGTPTPDAPVALESVGDSGSVTTTVCGKNLMSGFTGTKENPYSITAVRDDNAVVLKETSAYMESGKPYTFSIYTDGILGNENGSDTVEWLLTKDGAYEYAYNAIGSVQNGKRISKTIIPQATGLYSLRLDVNKNGATHSFWDAQVEEGTQATEYEPYNGGSVTVSTPNGLPGIPVASGGNYKDANEQEWICDEVDFEKGVYVQRVYRQTYIGSSNESWGKTKTTAKDRFYTRYMVSNTLKPCLCNMAVFIPSPAYQNGKCFVTYDSSNGSYYFQIIAGDYGTFPDPPAWRRYLGEHPLEVLYVMAEEKEIPLSEIDPDTLAQYAILHTNHPNTTVFNDGNAGMEVKYATPTTALPLTGGRYKVATPYAPTDAVPKSYADRIDKKVDTLREVVSSFHSNIVQEASGEVIQVYGSAEAPLVGLKVFGKTEQVTTTGKNLLDQHSSNWQTDDDNIGVKYSFVRDSNGNLLYINANGTANPGTISSHCKKSFTLLPAGTYIISGTVKQSNNSTGLRIGKGSNADYVGIETGDGYKITLTEETYIAINPTVGPGQTVSNLKFYPMIRLASEIDATYEPYTGGIPSPNPEYPQALESVGDSGTVSVTACGKNLLKNTATTQNIQGVIFTVNNDGSITATNKAGSRATMLVGEVVLPAGSYVLSQGNITNADVCLYAKYTHDGENKYADCYGASVSGTAGFTLNQETSVAVYIDVRDVDVAVNKTLYPMIRITSVTDNTYEPYKGTTATISTPNSLPGIPVTSGGNYTDPVTKQQWICDEVDFEKGVYVQRVYRQTYTGSSTEAWEKSKTTEKDRFYTRYMVPKTLKPCLCNMAGWIPTPSYAENGKCFVTLESSNNNYYFHIIATDYGTFANAQEWRRHLGEHPLEVLYVLAEEKHIPLSEIDPDALAQYATLHTNYPSTTILNDSGAGMDLKYVADTKLYVDKKFEELAKILINKL